jgi:hypothetical protein
MRTLSESIRLHHFAPCRSVKGSSGVGSECGCILSLEEVNRVDRGDSEVSLVDGRGTSSLGLIIVAKLSKAFHMCEYYHFTVLIT